MKKLITLTCLFLSSWLLSQNPNWLLFDHTNAPFVNDSITWVEIDTNNVKWVGTGNGLYSFNNNVWSVYNTSNSNIPSNVIDKFKIAYDNTIWFVNNGNGFYKFQNNTFTLYNQSNLPALFTQKFTGLTIDSNDVFLWSDTAGVVKFNSITNGVYNINTSNSYLKNIGKLVAHGNHMIYGVCKNLMPNISPQSFNDSVTSINDFRINNTPGLPINYYFASPLFFGTYFNVMSDRYNNRFEMARLYTGSISVNQRLRTYDQSNVLLSDIAYNQQPDRQIAKSNHGKYILDNNGMNGLTVTIFNPPSNNIYYMINSVIPSINITNFDIDTLNNVWLATAKGLVAYNDLGVVTGVERQTHITNLDISPNPTNNLLTITSPSDFTKIELLSITGALLLSESVNTKTQQLQLQNFAEGIYFVKVSYANGMTETKKVIKN